MKYTITLIMLATMSLSLKAQNQNNGQQQNSSGKGDSCVRSNIFKINSDLRADPKRAKVELDACEELKIITVLDEGDIASFDQSESSQTIAGNIPCKQDGSYTVDYKACKRVAKFYDSVTVAEQAMFATQNVKVNESNIEQNKAVAEASKKGDLQNGAINAAKERNALNKGINENQVKIYRTAFLALSTGLSSWGGSGNSLLKTKFKSLKKSCKTKLNDVQKEVAKMNYKDFSEGECVAIVEKYKGSRLVFRNDDSKDRFTSELGVIFKKVLDAQKRAGINDTIADGLKKAPLPEDIDDTAFDPCMTNANGVECKKNGPRNIKGASFGGTKTDFGANAGANQEFNFDPNGSGGIGSDPLAQGAADTEKVGDVASPFEQAAKDASGILNPAAAASATPGSQSSAPDGGGGGVGGGGSASLGDDLAGAKAEDNSDPDIKTTKVSGNYKSAKGGFQGVKGGSSSDDANPFASLFDDKGEAGGIEEDNSIAADGGVDSGLFQKISKKYGQVQQDKRLDSQNLE